MSLCSFRGNGSWIHGRIPILTVVFSCQNLWTQQVEVRNILSKTHRLEIEFLSRVWRLQIIIVQGSGFGKTSEHISKHVPVFQTHVAIMQVSFLTIYGISKSGVVHTFENGCLSAKPLAGLWPSRVCWLSRLDAENDPVWRWQGFPWVLNVGVKPIKIYAACPHPDWMAYIWFFDFNLKLDVLWFVCLYPTMRVITLLWLW